MPKVQNFHEKLEADIKRLIAKEERRTVPPAAPERSGRTFLKETIAAYAREMPSAPETSSVPEELKENKEESGVMPAQVKRQVDELVDLVFKVGLEAGIHAARQYSPFVQDVFHDALVDTLLPELEKRGILGK